MSERGRSLDALLVEMGIRGGTCSMYPIRREEMDSWIERLSKASGVPIFGLSIEEYAKQVSQLTEQRDELQRRVDELEAYSRGLDGRTRNRAATYAAPAPDRMVLADEALLYGAVVYALVDPRDPERYRYVGQSTNPVARYLTHMSYPSNKVGAWVRSLRAEGHVPAMLLVETVEEVELLDARELHWIRHCREHGQADLNQSIRRLA